jgi:anti-sigma-K factor RskA
MSEPTTPAAPPPASGFRRVSTWWRVLAVLLMMALLIGWAASASMVEQLKAQITHLQGRLVQVPQVRHIAVLLDDHQLPAMLVTYDPQQGALLLQRLNELREGREDSMQLWALAGDAPPRSLGVIESKYKTLELPVAADALKSVSRLAISAENKGGVPEAVGPRLPYLFEGWLVQKSI